MPANRSRTENFHDALSDLHQRGGSLELRIAPPRTGEAGTTDAHAGEQGPGLFWRVRLLAVGPSQLVVSGPSAAGADMPVLDGVPLQAAYSIGQNRWTFSTTVLAHAGAGSGPGRAGTGSSLVLAMPDRVSRCPRRRHDRVAAPSMGSVGLPRVECWALADPSAVAAAEVAHAQALRDRLSAQVGEGRAGAQAVTPEAAGLMMPTLGPSVVARLLNISGGGLGLAVEAADAPALERQAFLWARLDLAPQLPAPLAVTLRRLHSHLDSSGEVYMGASFDFAFHAAHQAFVAETLARYTKQLQAGICPHRSAA